MSDSVRSTNDLDRTSVALFLIAVSIMTLLPIPHPAPAAITASFCNRSIVPHHWFATLPALLQMLWTPAVLLSPSLELFSASDYWMRTKMLGLLMSSHPWPFVLCNLQLRDLFTSDSISQHAHHHHVHLSGCVSVCSKAWQKLVTKLQMLSRLSNCRTILRTKSKSRRKNVDSEAIETIDLLSFWHLPYFIWCLNQ